MHRNGKKFRSFQVAAIAAIVLATGLVVFAGEQSMKQDEEVALIGCLDVKSADESMHREFTLIERESGDWISVKGPELLRDHVGQTVKLLGDWRYDDMNNQYFVVRSVTKLAETCKE